MTTFGAMKARIADETLRSDLVTQIGNAIRSAIAEYRAERFWFNEASAQTVTTAGDAVITPPVGLVRVDFVEAVQGPGLHGTRYRLQSVSFEVRQAMSASATQGPPRTWAGYRDKILLYPVPDGAYPLWLHHLRDLPALEADTDSNAWLTEAGDLIRQAAKRILYSDVVDDERRAAIAAAAEHRALAALRGQSLNRTGTGRLRATAF